jgi:hypothetical protein
VLKKCRQYSAPEFEQPVEEHDDKDERDRNDDGKALLGIMQRS